jgi:hypothetical protein
VPTARLPVSPTRCYKGVISMGQFPPAIFNGVKNSNDLLTITGFIAAIWIFNFLNAEILNAVEKLAPHFLN